MSEQRPIENANSVVTKEDQQKAPDLAKLARVLERGVVSDRLDIPDLPPDMYVEWVRNDPTEIARYQALGFKIETEIGKDRGLHGTGDKILVGDVLLMSAPKAVGDAIHAYKEKRFNDTYKPKMTPEEAGAQKRFAQETGGDIKVTATNEATPVNATEILNSLKAGENP